MFSREHWLKAEKYLQNCKSQYVGPGIVKTTWPYRVRIQLKTIHTYERTERTSFKSNSKKKSKSQCQQIWKICGDKSMSFIMFSVSLSLVPFTLTSENILTVWQLLAKRD